MLQFNQCSEEINSNGGLSIVSRRLDENLALGYWNDLQPASANSRYEIVQIIRSMVGLMALGYSDYAAIAKVADDRLFRMVAGGNVPSEATFRQRMDAIAAGEKWQSVLDACVVEDLRKIKLTSLTVDGHEMIPLDIDVSVLVDTASHKEGIGITYHKVKGYAPIFCYAGREGYMVANELREGTQHSEKGAVLFLKRCVGIMLAAGYHAEKLLVRVDSGHDAGDFIAALTELGVHYIVKRNLRKESPEQILDTIRSSADQLKNRPGKITYTGFRSDKIPVGMTQYHGFIAVRAVERTITADGQRQLIPLVKTDCWWTNLIGSVEQCVALYEDHGTSEQFHSELKSDMGIELLPSGKMKTNALVLGLTTLAFNCLRFIGQAALQLASAKTKKSTVTPMRYRLRTVLLDFIKVGCKLVSHAHRMFIKFGRHCIVFRQLKEIYANC